MNKSRAWKHAGFTLITALAFSLVVGTVLAGVGTVAMSHLGRSKVEGEYANAMALADAGINYEFRWVSLDPTQVKSGCTPGVPGCPDQYPGVTGTVPGIPGNYTVYVHDWANGACSGNWTNQLNDVCVESTGTVDGISRTVRVRGIHKSVFDQFAIYPVSGGTFNGGGSGGSTTTIVGDMGTNGTLTFNGSKGTGIDTGTVYYNGPSANGTTGTNTAVGTDAVKFPSVSDWANSLFGSNGLTYLQTHNNNAAIVQLKATDPTLASITKVSDLTLANINQKLTSAGYTAASRTFSDPSGSVTSDSSALDIYTAGSTTMRFVQPTTPYAGGYGINGKKVFFIPPGDYYFTRLDFKQGSTALVFLTHLGSIRIWVDNTNNQADSLPNTALFTDPSPNKFRLFYNKCGSGGTLTIAGSSVFPGGFYAVNPGCGPSTPMLKFTGGSEVLGSVISQYLNLGGTTQVVFPNNAGGDPLDFALWFGFKDNWQEQKPNLDSSKTVFADGTSN